MPTPEIKNNHHVWRWVKRVGAIAGALLTVFLLLGKYKAYAQHETIQDTGIARNCTTLVEVKQECETLKQYDQQQLVIQIRQEEFFKMVYPTAYEKASKRADNIIEEINNANHNSDTLPAKPDTFCFGDTLKIIISYDPPETLIVKTLQP